MMKHQNCYAESGCCARVNSHTRHCKKHSLAFLFGRNRLSTLLLVCLCASCKTSSPGSVGRRSSTVALPDDEARTATAAKRTAPVIIQSLPDIPQRSVARTIQSPQSVVQSPPKPLRLAWDYPVDQLWFIKNFNVYSTTKLPAVWSLFATSTNQFVDLIPTNSMRLFYVTAVAVTGAESLPNTK
jgi:hypothetical protein